MSGRATAAASAGTALHTAVTGWFTGHARDLPWRGAGARPWPVLVSEVMLQQTPVVRVRPVFEYWLDRWPTPTDLAGATPGQAIRAWGSLGYPRRALRLHAAAGACVSRHGGRVPDALTDLRSLPGVGPYTAAAVASFAFGQAHPVLDTNVRRVLARVVNGQQWPAAGAPTVTERRLAAGLLPARGAPVWNAALMELGALVCTARAPACPVCPVAEACAWRRAGKPRGDAARPVQRFTGTDRQVRGLLLARVRQQVTPVRADTLAGVWPEPVQRARALAALVQDGLVHRAGDGRYSLPA